MGLRRRHRVFVFVVSVGMRNQARNKVFEPNEQRELSLPIFLQETALCGKGLFPFDEMSSEVGALPSQAEKHGGQLLCLFLSCLPNSWWGFFNYHSVAGNVLCAQYRSDCTSIFSRGFMEESWTNLKGLIDRSILITNHVFSKTLTAGQTTFSI